MNIVRPLKKSYYPLFIALAMALVLLNACASSTPARGDLDGFPRSSYNSEDINGIFPEAVYIKTKTQTFNTYHYYLVLDGFIWYKSINPEKSPKDWTLFAGTGVPHDEWKISFSRTDAVVEISADADELVALSAQGGFYRYSFDKTIAYRTRVWLDRQGFPKASQLRLDPHTARNRAWALGKRNMQVLYYEDPFGNQHHNGTMDIATTYMLLEDGQEIAFADNGLPSDFSRNFIGPERGAFKAVSLSASASTMFVINDAGEMYTRIADFDIVGCDPMLFKYTYIPYKSNVTGDNYFSNLNEWGLPAEDWLAQPRIPLAGKAALTRHITILQNGRGNGARELRVAGLDEAGRRGYWSKAIFADEWQFVPAPLVFSEAALLNTDAPGAGVRGTTMDRRLSGYRWNDGVKETEFEYIIPNFNILEGECDFYITWRGETCVLKLHPLELWTYVKRDYLPGRNGPPKMFLVTLEIPERAFDGLSDEFARILRAEFGKKDKKLFHYVMAASENYAMVQENGRSGTIFLAGETTTGDFLEFQRRWYLANFTEQRRYESAELMLDNATPLGRERYGELLRKIALNKAFLDELKKQVDEMDRNKSDASTLNSLYLPLHYLIRYTPLNFINVPKFNTITRYGKEIVLANSAYIDAVANTRIWLCRKLITLLEIRILCYTDMAKRLERGDESAAFPSQYSEYIYDYWERGGLPSTVSGSFFTLSSKQIPVSVQFSPIEWNYLGWFFAINDAEGNATSFRLFIDPRESVKSLYRRGGKTPEERAIRMKCAVYMYAGNNADATVDAETEAALQSIADLFPELVEASLTFNGTELEIKRTSSSPAHTLIFRSLF